MIVRPVRPEEAGAAGAIVVAAFEAVPGSHMNGGYAADLADVAARAEMSEVLVAVDEGEVVGCLTLVADRNSPLAEQVQPGECQVRMMGVAPGHQGRGIGQALLDAALERARALHRDAVFLHSTPVMRSAHQLYLRNGFVRVPERDWVPDPVLTLIAFRLELKPNCVGQTLEIDLDTVEP